LLISCKTVDNQQIYSILITDKAKPLPPPPLPKKEKDTTVFLNSKNTVFKNNKKVSIAVYPNLLELKINNTYNFNSLDNINVESYKSDKIFNKQNLSFANNNIILKILKNNEVNNTILVYKNYDWVLLFSDIIFNKTKNKAIVLVNSSTDKLSGSSTLYLLEKENGLWKIFKKKIISVS
jgi:hypothetical protein